MSFSQSPTYDFDTMPLREAPKHLRAEKTIYRPRFRHAGGDQTGAMLKPILLALLGLGLVASVAATVPHWPQWQATIRADFIRVSAANGYVVQNVQVTGRDRVPAKDLLTALSLERGMPLFAYDPQAAQDRVHNLTGIKNVFIERRWPNTVFIRLTERQPAVRWQKNEIVTLIDRHGEAVAAKPDEDVTIYPILLGDGVTAQIVPLFQLMQGEPAVLEQLKAASWIGDRRWDLTLKNGVIVKLPAQNAQLALSRLMQMVKEDKIFEKDLEVVDLRLPHQAVLRPTKRADLLIQRPDFSDPADPSKKNI